MIEMGLEIGDRIGIWSHNNVEWLLMQLATAKVWCHPCQYQSCLSYF